MASTSKNDLAVAIKHLAAERNLPREVIREALEAALVSAYKKTPEAAAQHITVDIETADGKPRVFAEKEVVEEVRDDRVQMTLEEARTVDPLAVLGGVVRIDVTPDDFGRIAAQTAKQVILQRIREAERDQVFSQYSQSEGDIIQGMVQSVDGPDVSIQLDKAEGRLPRKEQIPKERYYRGQRLKVYVVEVKKTNKGPEIVVSRTHRNMLRRLLELEVPEIFNGAVEIKAIAREAGSRSKVAVAARQEGIDPVGACVGMRGVRIQALVNELGGEKIDVVEWSPSDERFIANALSPAVVLSVKTEEGADGRTAKVVVPDKQLSLAIGKEGQNARLAAKLTGWRIDIKSQAEALQEEQQAAEEELRQMERLRAIEDARKLLDLAELLATEERAAASLDEAETPLADLAGAELTADAPTAETPDVTVVSPPTPVAPAPPTPATPPVVHPPASTAAPAPATGDARKIVFELPAIPVEAEEEEEEGIEARPKDKKAKKKSKAALVRDERTGRLVKATARKSNRARPEWEEVDLDEDKVDDLEGEEVDYFASDDEDFAYDPDADA